MVRQRYSPVYADFTRGTAWVIAISWVLLMAEGAVGGRSLLPVRELQSFKTIPLSEKRVPAWQHLLEQLSVGRAMGKETSVNWAADFSHPCSKSCSLCGEFNVLEMDACVRFSYLPSSQFKIVLIFCFPVICIVHFELTQIPDFHFPLFFQSSCVES